MGDRKTPSPPRIYVVGYEIRQAQSQRLLATFEYADGFFTARIVDTGQELVFRTKGSMRGYFAREYR
jgi:hypothetical protein